MPNPDVIPVQVKLASGKVTFLDGSGNDLGDLHVRKASTITFSIAAGSEPFLFNYCYVSPSKIDPCPPPGATPANPDEFTVSPAQPFSVATFTLGDGDKDKAQTRYHYTVEITPTATGTQQWADPQIVNYPQ